MPEDFGRYQLLSCIGKGGMAEVFRARLEVPAGAEKILVIKRILAPLSSDPEFIKRFVNEAKIALPLTHGNITSVFEFGEVHGQYYLAMEYIHGQNLESVLDRSRRSASQVPVEAALFIALEIAKGLAYAHGFISPKGERIEVVHLDVTPQNVLVSYDGAVKLTDFGIAKVKASREPAEKQELIGKASYLAPEQLDGDAVDGRTDIYSLGCVLYELLSSRRPFEGADDQETLGLIRKGALPLASSFRHGIEDIDPILRKAMAPNPADRFPTGAAFQTALTKALFIRSQTFGSHQLGEWMRELYAWDIFEEQVPLRGDAMRDRLLFQLSKAKVEVAGENSTSELLALRTVSIPPPPPASAVPPRASRRRVAIAVAIAAVVLFTGLLFLARLREEPSTDDSVTNSRPDAGPIAASMARVSLNSWPSAMVFVDGKQLDGLTPIMNHELPAGPHTFLFVRPDYDLKKELKLDIPAGEEKTIVVKLER